VPADSSVQAQIEEALLQMLGERVSWPELARRAGAALPVVILDGFDELLQATGMNRADYLDQIRRFQQREEELDRPVAVLVTSRTVVADRARFPDNSVVLRLEPFDEPQVRAWLEVWNSHNVAGLAARGLRPLPAETALAHGELAGQPLLLLLLALYDAGANALQSADGDIRRVDLYGRLFADFVEREVDKHGQGRTDDQRRVEIDAEWRRLSAVAVAILNRGGDVILEAELNADIPRLLWESDLRPARADAAARALTVSQLLAAGHRSHPPGGTPRGRHRDQRLRVAALASGGPPGHRPARRSSGGAGAGRLGRRRQPAGKVAAPVGLRADRPRGTRVSLRPDAVLAAAGTPSLHQIEGQTFLVSEAALFLRLLLSPPDAQPHELRAEQYRWAFKLTTMPRQRDLLIRQVFDEESWFSDAELQAIFISIMSSQLTDVPSPAEVLLGLIQRNFPIELDNPVRERLIQVFRTIGGS